MIWESSYWKTDLLKIADRLKKRTHQKKWFDSSFANAEKEIMISAFMIRKLFESNKIDPRIEKKLIKIISYKNNGKKINLLKTLSPERFFNIDEPTSSEMSVKDIYNNIIHSYIFMIITYKGQELHSFWVASDRNKFKFMYQIYIKDYIKILREVGNFWPTTGAFVFDDKKQDYRALYGEEEIARHLKSTMKAQNEK